MTKITNERLEELDKEFSILPVALFQSENGTNTINAFVLECSIYELACYVVYRLSNIKDEYTEVQIKDLMLYNIDNGFIHNKKRFILELSNRAKEEQLIELGIIEESDFIPDTYDINTNYENIYNSCLKYKENTELNIKLENTLPNKQQRKNNGKL